MVDTWNEESPSHSSKIHIYYMYVFLHMLPFLSTRHRLAQNRKSAGRKWLLNLFCKLPLKSLFWTPTGLAIQAIEQSSQLLTFPIPWMSVSFGDTDMHILEGR